MAGKQNLGAVIMEGILSSMWVAMIISIAAGEQDVKLELQSERLQSIEYNAPNFFPESFDWDAKHNRFIVGSMRLGKLVTVNEKGEVEEFVKDEEYSGAGILGVKVDSPRNRVLAVVHSLKAPQLATLVAYDLDSKKRVLFVVLHEEDGAGIDVLAKDDTVALANDVTVDGDGHAYVTNTVGNSVWKVSSAGEKSLLAKLPQQQVAVAMEMLKSAGSILASMESLKSMGANGIAHYDGYLLVGQTNSGTLVRVSLDGNKVQVVRKKGEDDFVVLPAADGMAMRSDGMLVVISTSTAWLLQSWDSWRSASVIDQVSLDESVFTTSVAVNDMRTFVLHSHLLENYNGANRDSFTIQEIEFTTDSHNNPLWLLAILGLFALAVLAWNLQMKKFNEDYNKKRG